MESGQKSVIVVGAGGHARTIVGIFSQMPDVVTVGVADHNGDSIGERVCGVEIIASLEGLPDMLKRGVKWAAIAVGDNQERSQLSHRVKSMGFTLMIARHPSTVLEPEVRIGEGCQLAAGVIVGACAVIGPGVILNTRTIVDHESVVGEFAHVAPGCCLAGRVVIGKRTFIGIGSTVADKVHVGADCIVGAGSVVLKDLPDGVVAFGVPARVKCRA